MDIFQTWPHRWFACWKGEHPSLQHFPAMQEFVDENWQCPKQQEVLHYLRYSPALLFIRPEAWRTDGTWLWWDGVAKQIEHENVRLPDAFLAHIARQNFVPLPFLEMSTERILSELDWPFVPFPPLLRTVDKTRLRKLYPTMDSHLPHRRGFADYLMIPLGELLRGKRT